MKKHIILFLSVFILFNASGMRAQISHLGFSWTGYPGAAMIPPKASTLSEEGHKSIIRFAVAEAGGFQGILATAGEAVDISSCAGIEFSIRHNLTQGKLGLILRLEQECGIVYATHVIPSAGWNKIFIPFDKDNFTGEGSGAVFGKVNLMRIYPYGDFNAPGQWIDLADVRLVHRNENTVSHLIRVAGYTHLSPPSSDDANCTLLTDGDKRGNLFYRQFGDEPNIEFDLGSRYALDEILVDAYAAPSHNFDAITITASIDGKSWAPVGILHNTQEGITEQATSYHFTPDKTVVGRYFRLCASRPRSDFNVNISEISFKGHIPSEQETADSARNNYDNGPVLPAVSADAYQEIRAGDWEFHVCRTNGVINEVLYKGQKLIERLSASYTLQTREKDTAISGYTDVVKKIEPFDHGVTVTTTNAALPSLTIRRTWSVSPQHTLNERVVVQSTDSRRYFLRIGTQVILQKDFRQDGFYEMPGSAIAAGMFRLPASEVQMDRALTNIPTLAFENGRQNRTLWHTRYFFNDRFTYMDVGTEEENLQIFKNNGWLLTGATLVPADAPSQSFENRLTVTDGRLLQAFDNYLSLPEVSSFRTRLAKTRPAWLRDVRAMISLGWDANYPGSDRRLLSNYQRGFSHRGNLIDAEIVDMDGIWGDLPTSGPVRGSFGEVRDATELRQRLADLHALDSRFRFGFYTWFWSAFPWSTPVKNHPEWFVKTLRNGAPASWFPGVNTNYLRFWGIPESRNEAVGQIGNFIRYYRQSSWYLDGGKSGVYAKDWDTMRIDDPLGQTDFYLATREEIQKDNPERVVVFNHSENPIGDMGFIESFGGTLTNEWRRGAVIMWKFKLYSYKDPLHHSAYTYWLPGIDGVFHNYMAGIGVIGAYDSRLFDTHDLPFHGARYDIRQAQLTEAHVLPNWRFDWNEELECMPLRQQKNGWVFMQYHGKETVQKDVSVNLAELGLNQPGQPVCAWLYTIRDGRSYGALFGEPQVSEAYRQAGWLSERAAIPQYLGSFSWSERFFRKITLEPGQAKVLMFSQLPAVVTCIEGDPVHYLLSGQPGIRLEGSLQALKVINDYKQAEVGLILPSGEVPSRITVNGQTAAFTLRTDHSLRLALVSVGPGESRISLQTRKGTPIHATSLEATLSGRTLSVKVQPEDAEVQIYGEGALALSRTGSFTLELPEAVRDGQYTVCSGTLERPLQILHAARPLKIEPILVPLQDKTDIRKVGRTCNGIHVLQQGSSYSLGAGETAIDAKNLSLKAGTIQYFESHFNHSSAALEIKSRRYLKLRLHNGFIHHTRYGYIPETHFVRPEHPGCFAGLMLDFGSADGYIVRSAASFGHQHEARKNSQAAPLDWGTRRPPERIYVLNRAIYDTEHETTEFWIDLKALGAPRNWNGDLWFTLHTEHICPDRSFTVEIIQSTDELPAGTSLPKILEIGAPPAQKSFSIRKINGKPDWAALPVLGHLTLADVHGDELDTAVKACYDDSNLYLHYHCQERPGHIITSEGGKSGKPWEGDSVEFILQRSNDPASCLHAIIDTKGAGFYENAPLDGAAGKQRIELGQSAIKSRFKQTKPGWEMFLVIPWSEIGGFPKHPEAVPFNLMRNRMENGKIGCYALSEDGEYFSKDNCMLKME